LPSRSRWSPHESQRRQRGSLDGMEIRKAIELKKKLVAAKTDSTNNSPTAMQGVGASWSTIFNFDSIKKALN